MGGVTDILFPNASSMLGFSFSVVRELRCVDGFWISSSLFLWQFRLIEKNAWHNPCIELLALLSPLMLSELHINGKEEIQHSDFS